MPKIFKELFKYFGGDKTAKKKPHVKRAFKKKNVVKKNLKINKKSRLCQNYFQSKIKAVLRFQPTAYGRDTKQFPLSKKLGISGSMSQGKVDSKTDGGAGKAPINKNLKNRWFRFIGVTQQNWVNLLFL